MTNSKSYSGLFKQSILGPPGWQWATANLAPCPTVNPCEKSFTHSPWNLCYRRELTCGTPYTRATLCHTHGISIVLQQSLLQQNPVNCVHSFFINRTCNAFSCMQFSAKCTDCVDCRFTRACSASIRHERISWIFHAERANRVRPKRKRICHARLHSRSDM